jgi:hypothetical protein
LPFRPTTGIVPGAPLSVDLRPFSFDALPANLAKLAVFANGGTAWIARLAA